MTDEHAPQIAGTPLPGGEYRISREENLRLCSALHTEPSPDGTAHPIYAYIATQSGMGLSVDGLLALCEFDAADGPMLASTSSTYFAPLETDRTYRVHGEIVGLTRKTSRKLGAIDVLEFRLTMSNASGQAVLATVNTWILPRRTAGG
jgi:hypothetical protein